MSTPQMSITDEYDDSQPIGVNDSDDRCVPRAAVPWGKTSILYDSELGQRFFVSAEIYFMILQTVFVLNLS